MKGRYGGRMTIYGSILPRAALVARLAVATSAARHRLKILDWHQAHNQNLSLTARRFGVQRLTIRRWLGRMRTGGITALNDRSRRPHRLRRPSTSWEVTAAVVKLRRLYPAWSKHKLQPLLAAQGLKTSVSTVGRILKRRGLIDPKASRKRHRAASHPKSRFPKGLRISRPGDLIQLDTKHVVLPQGRRHYQFTAIDVLTKRRVLDVYPSESSVNGANFLTTCRREFPFKVRAVQTDNGAPFQKEFEKQCKKLRLPHYFIYPRTPKQNTYVEISHGADKREFYLQGNVWQNRTVMREKLKEWQRVWNEVRPHEALNYLTPQTYFLKWRNSCLPTRDTITLQT